MKESSENATGELVIQPVLRAPIFESEEIELFQHTVQ